MKPLHERSPEHPIDGLLTDIDDTLTTDGRLRADAYAALESLQAAGLRVVPVTGRPAGWCDHIARMWPVDAVVGENGAFYMHYDRASRRLRTVHAGDAATRDRQRRRLRRVAREVLQAVPGCALASDQAWREADLAIDWCEDVAALAVAEVQRIVGLLKAHGLTVKTSSIHVNAWFGEYDKLTMTRLLLREQFGIDVDAERDRLAFVGDSPNDEPMFAFFPNSFGVANIAAFADQLTHKPAYVMTGAEGRGFAEFVQRLLTTRDR